MTCIAADCAVLHIHECFLTDNVRAACYGNKEVADLRRLAHRHYLKAVHNSFHSLYRVYLSNYDLSAQALRSHSNTLAAPAVARDNNVFPRNDKVRRAVYPIPHRLTRAVAVVEQMLTVRVVNKNHRELQRLCLIHSQQTNNARSGLLAAADNVRDKVGALVVDKVNEITAVVDDDVRSAINNLRDVTVVFFLCGVIPREHVQSVMNQRRRNVVLCRQRIAASDIHLRASRRQHLAKIRGLSLKVYRQSHLQPLERLLRRKFLFDTVKQRHIALDPFDLACAAFP